MCTIICDFDPTSARRVALAANRDERYARPAEPPALRDWDRPALAPLDLQARGTWLGINDRRVLAAITNRAGMPPDRDRLSRGGLVRTALAEPTARAAAARIAGLAASDYNGFHLLVVDGRTAHLVWGDGSQMRRADLHPGRIILTERSLAAKPVPREELVRRLLAERPGPMRREDAIHALHRPSDTADPFDGSWVDWPAAEYGTRATCWIEVEGNGRVVWQQADGPPGHPFADYSALARLF